MRKRKIVRLARKGVEPKRIVATLREVDPDISLNIVYKALRHAHAKRILAVKENKLPKTKAAKLHIAA